MRRPTARREVPDILGQHRHDRVADIRRSAADVRGHDDVGLRKQRVIGRQGLPLHAVQTGPRQLAGAHRPDQGLVVHQTAPGGVDNDGPILHPLHFLPAQYMAGGVQQRHMETDDIRGLDQSLQGHIGHAAPFLQLSGEAVGVVVLHLRAEGLNLGGHLTTNVASARDTYNEVTGTPAGAPLQGAVYEISEARSGRVVDYITTDARGVAASKPLPLGRYKITEVTAPAYWQVSGKTFDETLEFSGQIIKVSDYDKPSNLGVTITKRGNAEVLAGSQMRYDFTVANTSNVPLSEFYWHDRVPTDATRATIFTTGTYSARLNYRILYKTNYSGGYQVLASNLITSSNYSFSLNAIPSQTGEYVTDIYLDFGKVPVGFQSVANPTLTVTVSGTAANGYQLVNRADVGGKYQGTWQTAQATWVTLIRKLTNTAVPTLPKTGY